MSRTRPAMKLASAVLGLCLGLSIAIAMTYADRLSITCAAAASVFGAAAAVNTSRRVR